MDIIARPEAFNSSVDNGTANAGVTTAMEHKAIGVGVTAMVTESVDVETVLGEPVTLTGTTVITVITVTIGITVTTVTTVTIAIIQGLE